MRSSIKIFIYLLFFFWTVLCFAETSSSRIYKIYFSGNHLFTETELRRFSGLRIAEEFKQEALVDAVSRIKKGYYQRGYLNVAVDFKIEKDDQYPDIKIFCSIDENRPSRIAKVEVRGEIPAEAKRKIESILKGETGELYSENNLKFLKQSLLVALRNEGYLQAEIRQASVENVENSQNKNLVYQLQPREPITINFSGNQLFSPTELLKPLRLETRLVPFTPSAISSLAREIKIMYEAQGYFFAEVDYQELPQVGERKNYQIDINEGNRVFLRDIIFQGNTKFSSKELEALMESRPKGWFVFKHWQPGILIKELISSDLNEIENYYSAAGYPGIKVAFKLIPSTELDLLDLQIDIIENGEDRIKKVIYSCMGGAEEDLELKDKIQSELRVGALISEKIAEEEKKRITKLLYEAAYLGAKVEISYQAQTGELQIAVLSGPKVRAGNITVSGNYYIDDDLIITKLVFKKGKTLSHDKIRRAEEALYQTGFFRSVEIVPTDGVIDQEIEDLLIKVVERDTGSFLSGLALNSEEGLHVQGEIGQKNLWRSGKAVTLGVDGFIRKGDHVLDAGTLRLGVSSQNIFNSGFDHFVELFARYSLQLVNSYSYDRIGYSSNFRKKLSQDLNLGVFYSVFEEKLYSVPEDIIIDNIDIDTKRLSIFNTQLDWDLRDSLYNPRKGARSLVQGRVSTEAMGSTVNFYGFSAQQSFYFPLLLDLTLANNISYTYLQPFDGTDVIPLSQRLFLGGRDSLRGFSRNVIGPRGVEGDIVGGDRSLNFRSEFQLDITESIIGIMFLDAGQVFLENQGDFLGDTHNYNDLRFSPGFGFRYKTPIGPISAEYGFALDRENGERAGRFNFGIGSGF